MQGIPEAYLVDIVKPYDADMLPSFDKLTARLEDFKDFDCNKWIGEGCPYGDACRVVNNHSIGRRFQCPSNNSHQMDTLLDEEVHIWTSLIAIFNCSVSAKTHAAVTATLCSSNRISYVWFWARR